MKRLTRTFWTSLIAGFSILLVMVLYIEWAMLDGWMIASVSPLWPTADLSSEMRSAELAQDELAWQRVYGHKLPQEVANESRPFRSEVISDRLLHAYLTHAGMAGRDEAGLEKRLEELCQEICDLAPTEPASWQFRAMVMWRVNPAGLDSNVRYEEILGECRVHDPENGLYDYLEASHVATEMWAKFQYDNDEPVPHFSMARSARIRNINNRILELCKSGNAKKEFQYPEIPKKALLDLLEHYEFGFHTRESLISKSRNWIFDRISPLMADTIHSTSDEKIKLVLNSGPLFGRLLNLEPPERVSLQAAYCCVEKMRWVDNEISMNRSYSADYEIAKRKSMEAQAERAYYVHRMARQATHRELPWDMVSSRFLRDTVIYRLRFLVWSGLLSSIFLLVVARWDPKPANIGRRVFLPAIILAFGLTFIVTGAAPTGLLSKRYYLQFIDSLVTGLPFAVILVGFGIFGLRRQIQISVLQLLVLISLLAIAFALVGPLGEWVAGYQEAAEERGERWMLRDVNADGLMLPLLSGGLIDQSVSSWLNSQGLLLSGSVTLLLLLCSGLPGIRSKLLPSFSWWHWGAGSCLATGKTLLASSLMLGMLCMLLQLGGYYLFEQSYALETEWARHPQEYAKAYRAAHDAAVEDWKRANP